jgi:hypothetical protein
MAVMGIGGDRCTTREQNLSYEARTYRKVSIEIGVQDGFLGYLLQVDLT